MVAIRQGYKIKQMAYFGLLMILFSFLTQYQTDLSQNPYFCQRIIREI